MKNPNNQPISDALSLPTEKLCKKCPENGPQPLSAFSRVPSASDGRSTQCKKCQKKAANERIAAKKAEREQYGF